MSQSRKRLQVGERVSIIQRGKKQIWSAEFHWQGKHCRKSLKTRVQKVARGRAAALEVQLAEGTFPDDRGNARTGQTTPSIALTVANDQFIAHKKLDDPSKNTITKYTGILREFAIFCQSKGVHTVSGVTLILFDSYREKRLAEVERTSVCNESVLIKSFLEWCEERKLTGENPLAKQTFPKLRSPPRGGPTLEQINKILTHFTGYRRAAIATLAFAGMRASEVQHLRLDLNDVDFAGNWLHIFTRDGVRTKTRDSWKVPIHARLKQELLLLPHRARQWYFVENASPRYPNGDNHLNMKRLNEDFQKVLEKLGIPAGKKVKDGFTLHSLRSSFKTICINANIPRAVVDAWQNHKSGRRPTASDRYYRLSDEVSQEKMKLVPFGDG